MIFSHPRARPNLSLPRQSNQIHTMYKCNNLMKCLVHVIAPRMAWSDCAQMYRMDLFGLEVVWCDGLGECAGCGDGGSGGVGERGDM